MSKQGKYQPQDWEAQVNALLDGELSPRDTAALKAAASDDQRLARDIIEAYQLQQAMEQLQAEPAPPGLRRRLRRIPRDHERRPLLLQPRWAAAFAAVPLLVITLLVVQPREPSQAEIRQAAAELAIAFAYIDSFSHRTASQIEQQVGGELRHAVGGSLIRSIPQPEPKTQETQA